MYSQLVFILKIPNSVYIITWNSVNYLSGCLDIMENGEHNLHSYSDVKLLCIVNASPLYFTPAVTIDVAFCL